MLRHGKGFLLSGFLTIASQPCTVVSERLVTNLWIFTGFGFFSVIEHRDDPKLLYVRARVKGDLEMLQKKCLPNLGDIVETPTKADYPYRALAWRTEFAEAMSKAVLDINYPNFKSGITKTQGYARHDLYMKVWSVMKSAEETLRRIEADEAKGRVGNSWFQYDKKDDGRYGGKGSKNKYQSDLGLDLDTSRKARNDRLKSSGLSENMLYTEVESKQARERIEALVASQLKGTVDDFDADYEEESDTPPYSWVEDYERHLQESLQDLAESEPDDLLDKE